MNTQQINTLIKERANAGQIATDDISDGYHTFGELYKHRMALYIVVAKRMEQLYCNTDDKPVWKSKVHSDGSVLDGWFILGIFKDKGYQVTYHLPMAEWDRCDFAEELEIAPEWDGHTSDDVLNRLDGFFTVIWRNERTTANQSQKHVTASGYSNDSTRENGLS